MYLGLPEISNRGLRLRFVEDLKLENVQVEGAEEAVTTDI